MKEQEEKPSVHRLTSWASESTDLPRGRETSVASLDSYAMTAGGGGGGMSGGSSTMTITKQQMAQQQASRQQSAFHHQQMIPPSSPSLRTPWPSQEPRRVQSEMPSPASEFRMSSNPDTRTYHHGQILNERYVQHEVKVPRKVVVEEQVERTVVVPETIRSETIVEETVKVQERVVEVAKPVIVEKIVEVPEIQYIEKVIEIPETIIQEKVREVPRLEIREQITYVPRIITQHKIVEVPEIEYREVPIEKVVEVPEIREEVVIKEIAVPRYVEVPVPEYRDVEVSQDVTRQVPIPVECVTTVKYELPQIQPRYEQIPVPVYAPRFVEVPVPVEQMDEQAQLAAEKLLEHVSAVCSHPYPSLCEIEKIAESAKNFDPRIESDPDAIENAWRHNAMTSGGPQTTTARPSSFAAGYRTTMNL